MLERQELVQLWSRLLLLLPLLVRLSSRLLLLLPLLVRLSSRLPPPQPVRLWAGLVLLLLPARLWPLLLLLPLLLLPLLPFLPLPLNIIKASVRLVRFG
jgi:hypothetical protein